MLPAIVSEPIKFNLVPQQKRRKKNGTRKAMVNNNGQNDGGVNNNNNNNGRNTEEITLYPITVEFDRLLRRQQQLKRHSTSINRFSTASINFNSVNSKYTSIGSNDSTDSNSLLAGVDAKELLYSVIIHYYYAATLARDSGSVEDQPQDHDEHRFQASTFEDCSSCGGGAKHFECQNINNNNNNNNSCQINNQSAKAMATTAANASLFQLYQTLCTPGTRTIVLLANKNEVNAKIFQPNLFGSSNYNFTGEFNNNHHHHQQQSKDGAEHCEIQSADEYDENVSDFGVECCSATNHHHHNGKTIGKNRKFNKRQDSEATNVSEDLLIDSVEMSHSNHINSESKQNGNEIGIVEKIVYLLGNGVGPTLAKLESFKKKNFKSSSTSSSLGEKRGQSGFLQDLNRFLDKALQRKFQFYEHFKFDILESSCSTMSSSCDAIGDDLSANSSANLLLENQLGTLDLPISLIGIEQQLIGSISYYKSYRLSGIKMIELALISVRDRFQKSGIGSQLVQFVKENGQIGPYDVIRVKIPACTSSSSSTAPLFSSSTGARKSKHHHQNPSVPFLVDSRMKVLKQFFLRNNFTDDLILNASFEQLDGVCSDGDEDEEVDDEDEDEDEDDEEDDEEDEGEDEEQEEIDGAHVGRKQQNGYRYQRNSSSSMLHHSVSMLDNLSCCSPNNNDNKSNRNKKNKRSAKILVNNKNGHGRALASFPTLSMCYLPPFSISTLSTRMQGTTAGTGTVPQQTPPPAPASAPGGKPSYNLNPRHLNHHQQPPQTPHPPSAHSQTSLLTDLDNRYVDDIIDEANRTWRRDLLAAYRTQWSCVGRLRAEIVQLRGLVRQRDSVVDQLRRENYQLRTTLLQSERSKANQQLNEQRTNLFLLKNLNFDSLNF